MKKYTNNTLPLLPAPAPFCFCWRLGCKLCCNSVHDKITATTWGQHRLMRKKSFG